MSLNDCCYGVNHIYTESEFRQGWMMRSEYSVSGTDEKKNSCRLTLWWSFEIKRVFIKISYHNNGSFLWREWRRARYKKREHVVFIFGWYLRNQRGFAMSFIYIKTEKPRKYQNPLIILSLILFVHINRNVIRIRYGCETGKIDGLRWVWYAGWINETERSR